MGGPVIFRGKSHLMTARAAGNSEDFRGNRRGWKRWENLRFCACAWKKRVSGEKGRFPARGLFGAAETVFWLNHILCTGKAAFHVSCDEAFFQVKTGRRTKPAARRTGRRRREPLAPEEVASALRCSDDRQFLDRARVRSATRM